jgi:imidazolonepropionase-like amidohydrolase
VTRTLLHGGSVFDGSGRAPVRADVEIEDGRIRAVTERDHHTPSGRARDEFREVVDVTGMLVAPGLIDCHVHTVFDGMDLLRLQSRPFSMEFFEAAENLRRILASGVTTVRDAGGADLGIRTALEQGLIAGPRMQISISVLSQTGGHVDGWTVHGDHLRLLPPHPGRPDCVVDGVDEMRKRVRQLIRAGADVIKVCASGGVMSTRDSPQHPQFSYEELQVCVDEAAAAGLSVMAHAHGAAGIKQALRAGVRSIEHGVFLDKECIDLFIETGAWLVPTLLAPRALVEEIDRGMTVTPEIERKARSIAKTHEAAVASAHEAGVRIALGTDSGVFPHGASHRELSLLTSAGLSPQAALHAATGSAADLMGLDDVGRLAPGCRADIIVLNNHPWAFDRFAENLTMVCQNGRLVSALPAPESEPPSGAPADVPNAHGTPEAPSLRSRT